ncbi:TolC family protein [Lelliottia amnigena]|uniref:TolC family protein n=1 Tax=Lelliottia TaxID=1330545 RepID=UPI00192AA5E4|nr:MULTISPECIES: TolC family protein [Lelliottia]MBL5885385.1 TolC family protein [Lelliottia aquatilis]MBL5923993.1 TolC family protein [Lelliottia amnigena]MBL5932053.1 TolC family protein [Lelliottia amnigena]
MHIYILFPLFLVLVSCSKVNTKHSTTEKVTLNQCIKNLPHSTHYDLNTFLHEVNDDTLSSLVKSLDINNNDLKLLSKRVEREQNNIKQVSFDKYPSISINGGYGNSRIIKNGYGSHDSFSLSSSLSYNMDLNSQRKININLAELSLKIAVEESRRTKLKVIENFLITYWDVLKTYKELHFLKEERENYRLRLNLIESRFKNGLVNPVDVYAARQIINDYDDQIQNVAVSLSGKREYLAVFLDKSVNEDLPFNTAADFSKKLTTPAQLPLNILGCKPEIIISEYQLESELKSLDLQYSRYYPDISLSAALSSASSFVDSLFSSPVRSLNASLSLPFIEWYKIDADVDSAKISVEEARLDLRITVLNALTEVKNLVDAQILAEEMKENQKKSLILAKKRLFIAESRFKVGYSDLQSVLDAEVFYASAQKSLINAEVQYYSVSLRLLISIFGGQFLDVSRDNPGSS